MGCGVAVGGVGRGCMGRGLRFGVSGSKGGWGGGAKGGLGERIGLTIVRRIPGSTSWRQFSL